MEATKKSKRKSPNAYLTLFLIIVFIALLTWIIPGGKYNLNKAGQAIAGTYQRTTSKPQGLWQILMAPVIGMIGNENIGGAISISLFILMFGSLLAVVDESGAISTFLKGITQKNRNNQTKLIAILVIIMGIFGTVEGAYEEGFVYVLMILPVLLAMGLDSFVAVSIVVIGTQIGCLASTVNPFATGVASEIAGISPGSGLGLRIIMLVVLLGVSIFFIARYANKVKKNPETSLQYYRKDSDLKEFGLADNSAPVLTKEQKKVLILFVSLFVIMIIALVPWDSLNKKWTFFISLNNWIISIPFIGPLIGTSFVPLGHWYFNELTMLIMVVTMLCGKALHMDVDHFVSTFIKGAGQLVGTALIVPLARGIQVVMNDGCITPTILHFGEACLGKLSPGAFGIFSFIFYIPIAVLIPSSTGLAAATMSIMASLSRFVHLPVQFVITAYQGALGIVKMFAPTSIIVMTCTSLVHIEYTNWLKFIWKFLLVIFLLVCAFLYIGILI